LIDGIERMLLLLYGHEKTKTEPPRVATEYQSNSCLVCSKVFRKQESLVHHIHTHDEKLGGKPYWPAQKPLLQV
jgi:hypothetical protein